jgi:hypothetical protein
MRFVVLNGGKVKFNISYLFIYFLSFPFYYVPFFTFPLSSSFLSLCLSDKVYETQERERKDSERGLAAYDSL